MRRKRPGVKCHLEILANRCIDKWLRCRELSYLKRWTWKMMQLTGLSRSIVCTHYSICSQRTLKSQCYMILLVNKLSHH
ncbi:hypothetical protein FGO68_gene8240 [Halteria grandinella]|uniref:Uncharacterized protein n=1 Tax=Halteria grandinella TaxID=5974 RepID=A0A8J8NB83_HALGN|nr:hypothetical protein FGO68_gene8240 [Halteria grandinella]